MSYNLSINNKQVFDFYSKNNDLDFEEMNVIFINILNKMMIQITPNMDSNFASSINEQLKNLNGAINTMNEKNVNEFALKFLEFKKEYINDIKLLLNNNTNDNIKPLIIEYNQTLQDKTKILLNDIIPNVSTEIKASLKDMDKSFSELKILNDSNKIINDKVTEVLKKFENSSSKGIISENITYNLLRSVYAESQIQYVGNVKESGDIFINRMDKTKILIENKNYKDKVDQVEINKFINDIKKQNCSGILLSQRSSITNKNQFEINFYGSNIGIYISNVEYDTDKIQIGINIIDDIKKIMIVAEDEEGENHINDNEMEIINKEFNILSNQKLKHIKSIKEYAANLINEVNEMNLPTLHGILITLYGSNVSNQFICDKCGFVAKNPGSLASHKKKHKEININ
jgi:hypothetical protein